MDYKIFKMELLNLLQMRIGEDVKVAIERIPKNNGVFLDGIVFHNEGQNITPIIYIEDFYEFWKKGIALEDIVGKIIESFRACVDSICVRDYFFRSYEEMKPHIYYKIINYEKNREFLKKVPHRKILDLAMVYYYRMENMNPMATILIQKEHLELWNITEEELDRNAKKYTYLNMPAVFMTMAQVMEMEEDEWRNVSGDSSRLPMYVLTNQDKKFGAGTIFYPGILQQAEVLLGENFYILPSSIHECILVPEQFMYSQEELTRIVTEINHNHVDAREVLSNQAYYYTKHNGQMMLFS